MGLNPQANQRADTLVKAEPTPNLTAALVYHTSLHMYDRETQRSWEDW